MQSVYAYHADRVARGEGRVANERFRLIFSGTPCYVSMRRLIELFESWGGVFAYSDYLTFAAGGLDDGNVNIVLDELEAAHAAIARAQRNDLVVLLADRPAAVFEQLTGRSI